MPLRLAVALAIAVLSVAPAVRAQSAPDPWAPPGAYVPPPPGAPLVHLTFTADRPGAVLVRRVPLMPGGQLDISGGFQGQIGSAVGQVAVCKAPCVADVPAGTSYAVGGLAFRQSPAFEITGAHPRVKVDAHVGTENGLIGGIVLASVGGLVGLVGLSIVPIAILEDSRTLALVSAGGLVLGVAGVATGISMVVDSETKLDVRTAAVERGVRVGFVF